MRSPANKTVIWMTGISALILFICSSVRHELFQSTAWDLGIFDQVVYLISQGKVPVSSYLGFHILGDHAALIFYPLALLYKIYPSVYWLLAVQAVALAIGALPVWYLARQAGLKESQAIAISATYLLYPLIFNINLFDFHPEVIALPAFFTAVLSARNKKIGWLCVSLLLILSCKAVLSLTVVAMGLWLLVFEKKYLSGALSIISGIAWFLFATKFIIPVFGTEAASVARHLTRYDYLGDSFYTIIKNLFLHPNLILFGLFSVDNFGYLLLLLVPVIWGFSPQGITPLIGAAPGLLINLLADYQPQKDLIHQYSLPILPFLILAIIQTLSLYQGFLQQKKAIILWSLITFVFLARFNYFGGRYLQSLDTLQATKEAIALVKTQGNVLTTDKISPHLSHRSIIKLIQPNLDLQELDMFDYILLNTRYSDLSSNQEFNIKVLNHVKNNSNFKLDYHRDDVYLFIKL
ncbi:MAG: DUF2079 domain-containing protein [Nostoc sp. TH1S01]|nr:DUF2079 domain-containing protein [Nostoc sp. TH1S01]